MILGSLAPGPLLDGWRFVTSDAHGITDRLQADNPNARLVAHEVTEDLGIVVWFRREHAGAGDLEAVTGLPVQAHGGLWVMATHAKDIRTGHVLSGEPDERVMTWALAHDNRRRDPTTAKRWVSYCEEMAVKADRAEEARIREELQPVSESEHYHRFRSWGGKYPRIHVPDTAGTAAATGG